MFLFDTSLQGGELLNPSRMTLLKMTWCLMMSAHIFIQLVIDYVISISTNDCDSWEDYEELLPSYPIVKNGYWNNFFMVMHPYYCFFSMILVLVLVFYYHNKLYSLCPQECSFSVWEKCKASMNSSHPPDTPPPPSSNSIINHYYPPLKDLSLAPPCHSNTQEHRVLRHRPSTKS